MSSDNEFRPGLEGVIAVETEIAEPDREGGSLRYRGIDIEELVGHYPYEAVWGLLVDDDQRVRDRLLVHLAPARIEPDRIDVRTGSKPLATHDRLQRVRRRGNDVGAADRLLVRIDGTSVRSELRRERLCAGAVAACNADLREGTHARQGLGM